MNTTAKEARETKIFCIERYNEVYRERFIAKDSEGKAVWLNSNSDFSKFTNVRQMSSELVSCDFRIAETNLLDFVYASAEETTSPHGVEYKLHVQEVGDHYELRIWQVNGRARTLEVFATEDEALDEAFRRTYEYDFLRDDQRDIWYTESYEEAEEYLLERYADSWNVSKDVAKSILRKKSLIDTTREQRSVDATIAREKLIAEEAARYSLLIEKIDGEKYKETAKRLSLTIGHKIDSAVFHAAVKQIRK